MTLRKLNYVIAGMAILYGVAVNQDFVLVSVAISWILEMSRKDKMEKTLLTTIDILSRQVTERIEQLKNK